MDLCVFGCADSHDWLRYIKDMFTTELKEHPQLGCFSSRIAYVRCTLMYMYIHVHLFIH